VLKIIKFAVSFRDLGALKALRGFEGVPKALRVLY
jgi:hypothetical protein